MTILAADGINTTKHGIHYSVILCNRTNTVRREVCGLMVYEKKMLILSGEGSGVVMIEKSARGVRFALRTLGLARSDNARAGIITRKAVYVRDLPAETDPSAVFYIDDAETDNLHFAVFDARLRLYGTTAPTRMWEANVMDLLNKYGAPVVLPSRELPSLPPVSAPPRVLPAADGTGIPQSRLDIYGDDALAENDIYTSIDFSARMREVDGFLDTPRVLDGANGALYSRGPSIGDASNDDGMHGVSDDTDADKIGRAESAALNVAPRSDEQTRAEIAAVARPSALDGLAPHIVPPPDVPAYMLFPPDREITDEKADNTDKTDSMEKTVMSAAYGNDTAADDMSAAQKYEAVKRAVAPEEGIADFILNPVAAGASVSATGSDGDERETDAADMSLDAVAESADARECETADEEYGMPWELTARWLKSRSERQPVVKHERVRQVGQRTQVAALREVAFFERCRADIEKLFSSAPKDEELAALLPDIEWVRVEFGGHAVGVGRSDNAFLCYAVAGQYEKTSPLGDEAQWLPKLKNAPTGKGYWLIFQDLISGEIIGN